MMEKRKSIWDALIIKIGSAEEFAYDIIERIGVQKYRNTVKSMEYLTLEELRTICAQVGNMRLVEH